MSDWNQGYVTDVPYTYGYYREMAPQSIRFALNAAGWEAPPDEGYTYCELAFGQGSGLALMAAANPDGRFWGNDFNPSHVAGARRLAADAGLTNLELTDASFAEMVERDLPEFDYVALHGVWSWVGRENWAHIVEFLRRKLKVGGAVYISYNTMPGWSAAHPLREVLHRVVELGTSRAQHMPARIDEAMKTVERLKEVPGSYFARTPQIKDRVDAIVKGHKSYIAHEYLNRCWDPIYFAEMVDALAPAKLSFAAHASAVNCIHSMFHSKPLQELLDATPDPVLRETLRDMGLNTPFRRDLFVRGPRRLGGIAQADALFDRDYVLMHPRARCSLTIPTPQGEVKLAPEIYDPVLDALAGGRTAARSLMKHPGFADLQGSKRLLRALIVLCGVGYAAPCVSPAAAARAQPVVERFNAALLQRARRGSEEDFQWIASALIGSGLPQSRVDQFVATLPRGGSGTVRMQDLVDDMARRGIVLSKEGQMLKDPATVRDELATRLSTWEQEQRPLLGSHGLFQPR